MVNFSRSTTATYIGKDGLLKTAAANEPRFEKEGLLLEGQSVNLITSSNSLPLGQLGAGVSPVATAGQLDPMGGTSAVKVTLSRTAPGPSNRSFIGSGGYPTAVLDRTAVNTMSVWLRAISPTPVTLQMRVAGVSSIITVTSEWKRFSLTRPANHGDPADGTVYFACLQDDSLLSADIVYFGGQLEQLPFASSYIPTAGAAVTRAADVCWIPNALNVTPDYGDITIAMEVRRNLAIPSSVFPRAIHISDRQFVVADSARIMARGGGAEQVNISTAAPGTRERIAATIKGSTIACFLNGTKATLPQTPILPVSNGTSCFIGSRNGLDGLFGHVRNVRIWQRTLSDEQIKAAA